MGRYLSGAKAAAMYLGSLGTIPTSARVGWLLLPQLIGVNGFDALALDFARSLLGRAKADLLIPSFRARRLIGQGITADDQRKRAREGYLSLAEAIDPERIIVELCPTWYGGVAAFEQVPEADHEAIVGGLVEAGCKRAVVWVQGEPEVAVLTARQAAIMAQACARAIKPRPR